MNRPWEHEPNREEFEHAGLHCLILRNTEVTGCLNGYVGVQPGHPTYGNGYDDMDIEVHGGLTFASEGDGKRWAKGRWWFGFDTAHSCDYSPLLHERCPELPPFRDETYRDIEYVRSEVKRLAEQLAKVPA